MRKFSLIMMLVFALVLILAACGGGGDTADSGGGEGTSESGDPARGEELYLQTVIGEASAPGCITCHSLEPDVVLVGPSHNGMSRRAVGAVAGQSAEEYLEKSIREPNAHITEGYTEGTMYQFYDDDLSDQQIQDLVAFLMTQ